MTALTIIFGIITILSILFYYGLSLYIILSDTYGLVYKEISIKLAVSGIISIILIAIETTLIILK